MFIRKLKLKNFRSFTDLEFDFSSKVVLIEGNNGSGKTTLLEALHYACYLKSFRTNSAKDLLNISSDHFFMQIDYDDTLSSMQNQMQVGFSKNSKIVKLNQKQIRSYKEIVSAYRVVSSTEDDLSLILAGPDIRRSFLHHYLLLELPEFVMLMRHYRKILEQRNSLLLRQVADSQLKAWTEQLWNQTIIIQEKCKDLLARLNLQINSLLKNYFSDLNISIQFSYESKFIKADENYFEQFWNRYLKTIFFEESRYLRTLFGVHLDDFSLVFKSNKAKVFASRGQQKLIVLLAKIAQVQLLEEKNLIPSLLLDDFLTDFDETVTSFIFQLLSDLKSQVFITSPLKSANLIKNLMKFDVQTISLI